MKQLLSVAALFLCLSSATGQVLTILDEETEKPVKSAFLFSPNPNASAITNDHGQVDISVFEGAGKIKVSKLGYKTILSSYADLSANDTVTMVPSNQGMREVVISANRWEQNSEEVPQKITTVSAKQVALQNPQTAADLLAQSGNVFVQKSQQGGGSPMIRGFATNRLLYSVDGVRMNTAIFRGGNIQNVISLDPYAIEHTEILLGPGSVMYGSDAIGGVMSFSTLKPQLSFEDDPLVTGKAIMRYSSANQERTGHFDLNIGWKKWAILTSFSSNDYGDLRMGSNGPDEYLRPYYVQRVDSVDQIYTNKDPRVQRPSGYSQKNLMQKVLFKPTKNWEIEYAFHYSATSDNPRYDRHIRTKNDLPRYGEWYYGPQKWMMNNLTINHIKKTKLYDRMSIKFAQQYFEESRVSRGWNEPIRETRIEKVDAYSANFDFVKAFEKRNELFYGVEVVLNDVNSIGIDENIVLGTSQAGSTRYPLSSWSSAGAYVSDVFHITDELMAKVGVRYNQYMLDATFDTTFYDFSFTTANINNGALTGSAGLVYEVGESLKLSTNFARAFRTPNIDDIGKVFDSEPGAVVVPNPDLEAEYANTVDLGATIKIGEVASIDASAFYTMLENALVRRDYQLDGQDSIMYDGTLSRVQAIQNASSANVYGFNANLNINLENGFSFSTNFNYQFGEEELEDGSTDPMRHVAPWFGVSRLSYSSNRTTIELNAQYSGGKSYEELAQSEQNKGFMYAIDANGNPYSPGWYTLNVKALVDVSDYLSVSGGIENLTDIRYRPYSSGIAAAGRNFILSVRAKF